MHVNVFNLYLNTIHPMLIFYVNLLWPNMSLKLTENSNHNHN